MARSDLVLNLIRSKISNDDLLFEQSVEALIVEEKAKQHHVLADQIKKAYATRMSRTETLLSSPSSSDFFSERLPKKRIEDLVLADDVISACEEIVEEHFKLDLLRSYGIEPRHKVLLAGPPGNGKTSLAEAIAESLGMPLLVMKYEAVITSYLGESNQRLSQAFDEVTQRRCVLFFDEFEVISKERSDDHETGEMKRLVSNLLLKIDSLPSNVVVVAATNHEDMLDSAAWRRFEIKLTLGPPGQSEVRKWVENFSIKSGFDFYSYQSKISAVFKGRSYSDLETFGLNVLRRYITQKPDVSFTQVITRELSKLTSKKPTRTKAKLNARR